MKFTSISQLAFVILFLLNSISNALTLPSITDSQYNTESREKQEVLNFDEPFGTQSWEEDGHQWNLSDGWDNIRSYNPYAGSGHVVSASGGGAKLSTDRYFDVIGLWLIVDMPECISYLQMHSYDYYGNNINTVVLDPYDYEMSYGYVTLNWSNVYSIQVDWGESEPGSGVFYDEMDYHFIPEVLNFDESFGTQSWEEDGHQWNLSDGWDNIRSYNPYAGSGHVVSASGGGAKLSTVGYFDITGLWLIVDMPECISYLQLHSYDYYGNNINTVVLDPYDYEMSYSYVTLNWSNVYSIQVDWGESEPGSGVFYDEMDYYFIPFFSCAVTTQAVSDITHSTATGNGNITELGDPNPEQYGLCWNTSGVPTIADSKTEEGSIETTGAFTSSMTGLSSITTYYVRAYATNGAGTVYGNEVNFTTAALNSPQNLIGVETAGEFTLTWDPVDGATGYKVYACEEPYGVFQDVTNEGNFNGESWSYTYSEQKRFFYVVAQDDTKKK